MDGRSRPQRVPRRSWRAAAGVFRLLSAGRYEPKWVRLACHPLLAGYPVRLLRRVASVADEANVGAGKVLAKQGCAAEWFVLVHSGMAELVRDGTRLGGLGPGEHFGEVALLGRGAQPVTIRAVTPMTICVIGAQRFLPLVEDIQRLRSDMEAALLRQRRLVELARNERSLRLRLHASTSVRMSPITTDRVVTPTLRTIVLPPRQTAGGRALPARWTAALAGVVLAVMVPLAATAILYHPPLVVIVPGPAVDVSGDVTISGVPAHRPRGHYLMLTTRTERPNLLGLGLAMLHLNREVLPADRLRLTGPKHVKQQGDLRAEFAQSRIFAADAAARAAGMTVTAAGQPPFAVRFRHRDIVGPSAGLVYALTVEDMLSVTDRAHGRTIAATGEIDPMGAVSAVGYVDEKAEAARHAGGQLLLVPQSDVPSTLSSGVPVAGVVSLDQALALLASGRQG